MWGYLKKIYNQNNTARMFQLEHEIVIFQHDSLSISKSYSHFMNLWVEYTDIIYKDLSTEGQTVVQNVHDTTKRNQFLMKLRYDFEGIQTNLMNQAIIPSLDECLNELLREERLLTQTNMEQQKFVSLPVTYCKKGHIIKECQIRPPRRNATAFTATVGSSTTPVFVDQNLPASMPTLTPEMKCDNSLSVCYLCLEPVIISNLVFMGAYDYARGRRDTML
ncbi:hypothetical protein GmHk_13G036395 [Glycine max]|nr:hypothetical protein GmHk_13G036395 [Glycine max]